MVDEPMPTPANNIIWMPMPTQTDLDTIIVPVMEYYRENQNAPIEEIMKGVVPLTLAVYNELLHARYKSEI